ncbi:MAG TPA: sigma-54-dependent Fis family transcriptional regulator, partial [Cytophagales bacterium]|nr:sigma-54-dependent Fis family transcriptional regulator [Cytophagales bacterium]
MAISEAEIQSVKQRFGVIGNSPLLNNAVRVAMQVAPTDMSVLITGESGSGKESFSKIIHHLSARKHGQFIAINCGSIPEGTIDSELFGHEKGSFTGAHESRKGYFEVTNGGTIFLDEIGEMPLGTQARLLRVLENGEFIKVGSSKVLKTDVRVVAATNVNLLVKVEQGKFREDLYYRLSTVPIYVPPLRERGKDVELLFRKFATDFAEKYKVKPIALTDDAKSLLVKYRFPGNIRQLKNMVEQISVLSSDNAEITGEILAHYIPKETSLPALYKDQNGVDNISEREILYKILFDLRKDMNDLKKIVLEGAANPAHAAQLVKEHAGLFEGIDENISAAQQVTYLDSPTTQTETEEEVQDITHEAEDDSLSIVKKEKE